MYHEKAVEYARGAGEITLRYFRTNTLVDTKDDNSPVTRADREAEAYIRDQIHTDFPDHGVLGEEDGYEPGTSPFTWVIDPIDGTKSFVAGVPLYTVLVALIDGVFDGSAVLPSSSVLAGVIHAPAAGETVSAARGQGASWSYAGHVESASVSSQSDLGAARVLTTDWADLSRREPELFRKLANTTSWARTWADAYGYLLVATGRADCMVDPIMSPWDIGPLPVIIEEAGGFYGTLSGKPELAESAVATTPGIAQALFRTGR
jgi:histidinol phosphatase-like enzyme (inositol monophosphatase family)